MFIILLTAVVSVVVSKGTCQQVVNTTHGLIRGLTKQYPEGTVLQFRQIPFASAPTGNLRYQKPIAHRSWNNVLDATNYGPSCVQYFFSNDAWLLENKNTSEDCLHLNIFIPHGIDRSSPKAIMIWIHGGGYTGGQGTLFDGSYLALTGNVIVVTTNYRLGILGFLSTEDESARGNYGLWDQRMAIEWTRDNAYNLGGDANRITIFGESAGGYSVGLQSVAVLNKGLFHRVISESGAVYSPRALASDSRKVAFKAGRLLNCPDTNSSSILLQCLRSKTADEILRIQSDATAGFDKEPDFIMRLGPVMDGELILDDPVNLLNNLPSESLNFFLSLDIMAGTNNAEGGLIYWRLMELQKKYSFNISGGLPTEVLCKEISPTAARSYFGGNQIIAQAICEKYTVHSGGLTEQARSAVNVYADLSFIIPTVKTLMAHAIHYPNHSRNTFHYLFSHQPSFSWIQDRPVWLQGANHAGELPFVFGLYAMYPATSPKPREELTLSKQMMTYWTNFAKHGDPNAGTVGLPKWSRFDTSQQSYMNLTINPRTEYYLYRDRVEFWTKTVPSLIPNHLNIPVIIFG